VSIGKGCKLSFGSGPRVESRLTAAIHCRVRSKRSPTRRLSASIEAMPFATREAMLEGIDANEIIVGAYVDNRTGGICPMLAAHRSGGRANFDTFARAWDQFTDANPRKPRRASRREIRALRSHLERSLGGTDISGGPLGREVRRVQSERRRLAEAEARAEGALTVERVLSEADVPADDPPASGARACPSRAARSVA
jgi:hypothetical protein